MEKDESLKRKLERLDKLDVSRRMLKVGTLPCIFLFFIGSHSLGLREVKIEVSISRVSGTQYKSILNYFGIKRVYVQFEVAPG